MPWYFWIFVVIALIAVTCAVLAGVTKRATDYDDIGRQHFAGAAVVFGVIALLLGFVSSLTFVPANEVGVVTNFGAWSGTRTSGISFTAPWSKVDTFGTRNQKSIRDRAETEGSANCVDVKMSGGSTGCQDLTVLYTIDEANAEKLWRGWKDFSKLNVDLVQRQTDDAVLAVYPNYTPLDAQGPKRNEITEKVTTELRKRLEPQGVRLESITLGTLNLPENTQKSLNDLIEKDTRLQIALKDEQQAKAEAAANQARQVGLTPEGLVLKCLETVREAKPAVMPSCGLGSKGEAGALVQVGPKN